MAMRCSRVGCGGLAVASFCFDGRAALVWLDPLDPDRGLGAGVLCARHAETLTPPRGWHLQDRRGPAPRLWDDRPVGPARRHAHDRTRSRAPAPVAALPRGDAPVEATEPLPFRPPPGLPHRGGAGRQAAEATAPDDGFDVDQLLDANTRLLARAFSRVESLQQ